MRVCVVLVNFNGGRDTVECLETLFRSDFNDFRVVVCDNGSADGSLDEIARWASVESTYRPPEALAALARPPLAKPIPHARYGREEAEAGGDAADSAPLVLIDCGANLGFAGGNNVGLRYALARGDFDYVWLLNNDTAVEPDALRLLVQRMEEVGPAGLGASTLLHYEDPARVQALGGGWYCKWLALAWHLGRVSRWPRPVRPEEVETSMSYPVGASLMVSRPFLEEVGLMCEEYFLYFEELDWVLRAEGRFRIVYAPESIVYHKVGGSIGTSSHPAKKSYVCDFWNVRNRIFFTRRWFPWALPTVYLMLAGTLLTRLLLGKWDRAVMLVRLMSGGWKAPAPAGTAPAGADRGGRG